MVALSFRHDFDGTAFFREFQRVGDEVAQDGVHAVDVREYEAGLVQVGGDLDAFFLGGGLDQLHVFANHGGKVHPDGGAVGASAGQGGPVQQAGEQLAQPVARDLQCGNLLLFRGVVHFVIMRVQVAEQLGLRPYGVFQVVRDDGEETVFDGVGVGQLGVPFLADVR